MALAQDAAAVSAELSGPGGADSQKAEGEKCPETRGTKEEVGETPKADSILAKNERETESGASAFTPQPSTHLESTSADRSPPDRKVNTTRPPQCPGVGEEDISTEPTNHDLGQPNGDNAKSTAGNAATDDTKSTVGNKTVETTQTTMSKAPAEPTNTALDKELEALLSLGLTDPAPHDILMIQSEHNGTEDIVKVDSSLEDSSVTEGKGPPPPLRPATTWTSANLREFKHRMAKEKHGLLTIRRGEVVTVRVPTHPDGKRLCWEFATEDYDIGFGIYFDWTPVTSTAVTLQVSESSDEEEEEDTESPWHSREGDVERGSVYRLRSRYGEIMQVYRRDSHREVQAGSHEYPGEGVYLLKLDNSYSLLRSKTLYFHVYYSS